MNYLLFLTILATVSCQTGSKKSTKSSAIKRSESRSQSGSMGADRERFSSKLSGSRKTLVTNLTPDKNLSRSYSTSTAKNIGSSVLRAKNPGASDLMGAMSAKRLGRSTYAEVFSIGKKLSKAVISKNIKAKIPEEAIAELAISAMANRKYHIAEQYILDLVDSKNSLMKATGHNLAGVLSLIDNRVPEAVVSFKASLKARSSYEPAKLNLGFLALKYGDFSQAKRMLSGLQDDWLVNYAYIAIDRMDSGRAASGLCPKVLGKQPKHGPTLLSCGLYEAQGGSPDKAKSYLNRAKGLGGVVARVAGQALKKLPSKKSGKKG